MQAHTEHRNTRGRLAPRRLAVALAAALWGSAGAQTVVIDQDQAATVVLPAGGGSAEVRANVRITPSAGAGIETGVGDAWSIVSFGSIASAPSGPGNLDGLRFLSGGRFDNRGEVNATNFGVVGTGSFEVDNHGTIAGATGVQVNVANAGEMARIVNDGTIRGVGVGLGAAGTAGATQTVSIENRGTIEASSGSGVRITHGGAGTTRTASVSNATGATIRGSVGSSGIVSVHGLTRVDNAAGATIQGGVSGIWAQEAFSFLDIDNAGAVVGGSAAGIRAYGGGTVRNREGGSITGAGGVSFVRSLQGTENALVNAGSITATSAGFVAGAGPTAGAGAGVYIGGSNDAVGVRVDNLASGTIDGRAYGLYAGAASQPTDPGPVIVHNAGAIEGDIGIAIQGEVGTVANAGTIVGRNGIAIRFDATNAFANTLVLQTGSTLQGDVFAGPGAANALILEGAGSETGDKLRGFATLAMRGTDWTFEGDLRASDHASIESGALRIDGTLIAPRVDIHSAGTLAGNGLVIGDVDNAGALAPGGAAIGTLTLRGDYVGNGDAIVVFDTQLGDDASPTDRLVFDGGTAQGNTRVIVRNVGGAGAATAQHGIRLVEATNGATTAEDAFAMPGELRVGAFDYRLFRGGLAGHDAESWYLRSEFFVGPPPPPPTDGGDPPPLPIDPPPTVLPPGAYPIVGPELATHGVVQPLAREFGWLSLGSFHARRGDVLAFERGGDATAWARAFGASLDHRYRAYVDPRAIGDAVGVQAGVDLWRDRRDRAGVFGTHGELDADVDGLVTDANATRYIAARTGRVALRGTAAGAYWTHVGDTGWFVDTIMQGMRFDGRARTAFASLALRGDATTISIESGLPGLRVGSTFVLEPQAQLAWQGTSFDPGDDGLGQVWLASTSGVTGRVGARGVWTLTSDGRAWRPWWRANLLQDNGAFAATHYAPSDVVPLRFGGTRLDLGVGVGAQLSATASLFASLTHQFGLSVDGDRRFRTEATAGFQLAW